MATLPTDRDTSDSAADHASDHNTVHGLWNTLTTKGDLLTATGAQAYSRLGVGTNGHVLTADSAEATGIKWAASSGSSVPYRRQGGSATDWSSSGTSSYTPTSGRIQVGALISGTMAASGFSDVSVTFPVAFSQVPLVIVGKGPVANNGHVGVIAKSVTTTGFTLGFNNFSASNDVTVVGHWMAIGEA